MNTKMKRYIGISLAVLGTTALAAEQVDEIMDAAPDGIVSISNVAGSVEVEGWTRNQVQVTGELGDDVDELVFERDGDEILVRVKVPKRGSRDISSDLTVRIPRGSSVRVNTVSADIEVSGVEGEQRLEAVSGDILTEVAGADIDVDSVSGDIEVRGSRQAMRTRVNTVSGDFDSTNLAGEISAESVSGDLTVDSGRFERASLHTVNGDIEFRAALHGATRMDVETINGEVDIVFDGDVSARFDIETFNGSIDNCFGPESVRTSRYAPGRELKFNQGSGDGRVTIKTLNGDVTFCK